MSVRMVLALAGLMLSVVGAAARGVSLQGRIVNAGTGEPLPLASVQMVEAFTGTITNEDGFFILEVPHLPATLRVSYIGYATEELTIADSSAAREIDLRLRVSPYRLPEMVVRPDEARHIMAEVIRRKAEWRPRIQSWRSEAYTRMTMLREEEIIGVVESVSEVHWQREGGYREVIVSQRLTDNLDDPDDGFGTLSAMEEFVNLYDDEILFMQHRMVGPTSPDALAIYDFELLGRRVVDDQTVFDIGVRPKHKPEAAFVGQVAVVDGDFALIEAQLQPNRAIVEAALPIPLFEDFTFSYGQQWRNYDGVWLPVDYRFDATIRIGTFGLHFPEIGVHGITRMSKYEVNIDLPDSLFVDQETVRVDSVQMQADTAFTRGAAGVPLTADEEVAYATIDSTRYLAKELRPSGLWTRFMPSVEEMDEQREKRRQERREHRERAADSSNAVPTHSSKWTRARNWLPQFSGALRANRVEEAYAGADLQYRLGEDTRVSGGAGYSTGVQRFAGTAGVSRQRSLYDSLNLDLRVDFKRGVARRYESSMYHSGLNSVEAVIGLDDYFDYSWREMGEVTLSLTGWRDDSDVWFAGRVERQQSLTSTADIGLLQWDDMRPNPPVHEVDLHSVRFGARFGEGYTPFGVTANRRLALEGEIAADWLGSDADFSIWRLTWDWQQDTFWTRRWLPNTLDLHLLAGTSTGDVPPQRHTALDVAMGPFSPFGAFRSVSGHPYEGSRYAALFWEHNFRTVPFEYLGAWGLVRRGMGLILHGASGRTWPTWYDDILERADFSGPPPEPRSTRGWHHEIGFSLTVYGMVRVDVTRRLDRTGWRVGGSLARFDFD
jgi:hypothetical protein